MKIEISIANRQAGLKFKDIPYSRFFVKKGSDFVYLKVYATNNGVDGAILMNGSDVSFYAGRQFEGYDLELLPVGSRVTLIS